MKRRSLLLVAPALGFVVLLFFLPFLGVARVAVAGPGRPGSRQFYDLSVFEPSRLGAVAADPLFSKVLGVTLRLGLIVAVVCTAVAIPYAAYIHRAKGWRKRVLIGSVLLPKLVNLLVLVYGVTLVLGRQGFLNQGLQAAGIIGRPLPLFGNLFSVVFTELVIVLPYPVLILLAGFHASDPRHYEAARALGAGPGRAYLETVVRPAAPAVAGAALVSAIWGVGAFVGPLVLGNPPQYTMAVEIYDRALERLAWVDAAGWSLLGLGVLLAVIGGFAVVFRRGAIR